MAIPIQSKSQDAVKCCYYLSIQVFYMPQVINKKKLQNQLLWAWPFPPPSLEDTLVVTLQLLRSHGPHSYSPNSIWSQTAVCCLWAFKESQVTESTKLVEMRLCESRGPCPDLNYVFFNVKLWRRREGTVQCNTQHFPKSFSWDWYLQESNSQQVYKHQ